ncbi:hypothetical protein F5X96DRAFT_663069 [Biscogniauxia mediterranea]|nr:hypothetical protein F5X96DRAFT_663069 [Biscogniauxia mediterranea]
MTPRRRIPCPWCDQVSYFPSNRRLKDHVNKHHRIGPVSQQPPVRTTPARTARVRTTPVPPSKPQPQPQPQRQYTYEEIAEKSQIPLEDMAVELPSNLRKASKVHLTTHFAQVVQNVNLNLNERRSLRKSFKRVHRAFREELVRLFNERGAGHLDLAL